MSPEKRCLVWQSGGPLSNPGMDSTQQGNHEPGGERNQQAEESGRGERGKPSGDPEAGAGRDKESLDGEERRQSEKPCYPAPRCMMGPGQVAGPSISGAQSTTCESWGWKVALHPTPPCTALQSLGCRLHPFTFALLQCMCQWFCPA